MSAAELVSARGLPDAPLDAAERFHATVVQPVRALMASLGAVVVLFDTADHTHENWRVAAIQELAREAAPGRVNAIAGADPTAIDQAIAWLAQAPGVTGQILQVDGNPSELA